MNLVHAPTPTQHPLFTKTNTPRLPKIQFKLPIIGRKSAPTVSVTNTNVARTTHPSGILLSAPSLPEVATPSSIPFPSSPIPCPSPRKRAASEDGYVFNDVDEKTPAAGEDLLEAQATPIASPHHVSRSDILRRRHKSCLAASFFHHDAHLARKPPTPPAKAERPVIPASEQATKRPVARRESMSAGTPTGKNIRKARRALADAQFLASVHSSIASHIRARMDGAWADDDYAAQDALLVERIWHALVDMGCKPVPLQGGTDSATSPSCSGDLAREAAERAARRTAAAACTPISVDRVQDIPLAPTGILAVPQLVAILTMRHRDRTTTRPRSAAKKRADEPLSRSPLSTTVIPPSASEPCPLLSSG
ncbi:hypothetical protein BD414DRAFT_183966 [Trametes punicea]|nr:hypothetical protein BD414DRAFT_183966 [Trametes punicea]